MLVVSCPKVYILDRNANTGAAKIIVLTYGRTTENYCFTFAERIENNHNVRGRAGKGRMTTTINDIVSGSEGHRLLHTGPCHFHYSRERCRGRCRQRRC